MTLEQDRATPQSGWLSWDSQPDQISRGATRTGLSLHQNPELSLRPTST